MNLKNLGPPNWIDFFRNGLLLLLLLGATLGAAGDFRWLKIKNFDKGMAEVNTRIQLASAEQTAALKAVSEAQKQASKDLSRTLIQFEINSLDSRITFLRIKVQQAEATESEKIILPTLERQLRELQRQIE